MPGKKSVSGSRADGGRKGPAVMRREKEVWWASGSTPGQVLKWNALSYAKCIISVGLL